MPRGKNAHRTARNSGQWADIKKGLDAQFDQTL